MIEEWKCGCGCFQDHDFRLCSKHRGELVDKLDEDNDV